MKSPRFDVYQDRKGEWRWRLLAGNGRTVADSGEGYKTKQGVQRAIDMVRRLAVVASSRLDLHYDLPQHTDAKVADEIAARIRGSVRRQKDRLN